MKKRTEQEIKDDVFSSVLRPMMEQMRDICEEVGIPMLCTLQTSESAVTAVSSDTQSKFPPIELAKELFSGSVSVEETGIGEYSVRVLGRGVPMFVPSKMMMH